MFSLLNWLRLRRNNVAYEYKVLKLGSSSGKNENMINKQSEDGWELFSTVPMPRLANSGIVVNDIQAFFRRKKKTTKKAAKKKVING